MKDRFLFSVCPEGEFFDRAGEIDYIVERASGDEHLPGIFLSGKRWTGKTEVLRRAHAKLFWEQARVLPVYYQFRDYGDASGLITDYIKESAKQVLAFRARSPRLVGRKLSLEKIEAELARAEFTELSDIAALHREASKDGDMIAVLRNAACLSAAIQACSGIPAFLLLDDIDEGAAALAQVGRGAAEEFLESLGNASSFVASGSTAALRHGGALRSAETMRLGGLAHEQAVAMMMELCRLHNVGFDTEILSLAADKLDGNPMYIKSLVWAARSAGSGFFTLKDFIDLYAKEIFDGNIGLALASSIGLTGPADLALLNDIVLAPGSFVPEEELAVRPGSGGATLDRTMEGFTAGGFVDRALGSFRWAGGEVARDFVRFNYEIRVRGRSAEEVRTRMVRDGLKEGYDQRGAVVRGRLKEDAAATLGLFNGQKVPRALFDHKAFCAARAASGDDVVEAGEASARHATRSDQRGESHNAITLPQVIGRFDSTVWEKDETGPLVMIADGFENNRYDAGNEVVWITAVKDSITPVNVGDVENFLRRAQILRQNFRTTRAFRWMIGKEGFTAQALARLASEGVFSSDGEQLGILADTIAPGAAPRGEAAGITPNKEFEVILPPSSKSELVAAKAVEEIGIEMGFDEIAIGQIKAALIEACINAFEHSMVKAGRVFLRFVSGADRLAIHVQNGGLDFDRSPGRAITAAQDGELRKRGWGLELMKSLMDEVRFEKIRGGTKIVMVKYLLKGDNRDAQA